MHKGVILIVKAQDKDETISLAKEFLESYKDDVWDWYQIGGRWQNALAPKGKEFFEKTKSILEKKDGFISQSEVDNKQSQLQKLWEELGMKGSNPYSDHYKLDENGNYYDVLPLSECLEIVKDWKQTQKDAKKEEKKAKEWLNKKDKNGKKYKDYRMYGYCLKIAGHLYHQDFCFDCNVFNTEDYDYSIPKNVENYYAIMIDMHN